MPRTIQQTVTLKATPQEVYEALLDSHKHAQFTGAEAQISREAGGAFTAYNGGISGVNLELVPAARIVQSWRCQADGWPDGHFSTLTINLAGETGGGTRLELVQSDVPDAAFPICDNGWRQAYWEKMKATFGW